MTNKQFFKNFIKTTSDCFNKGWNERNGGNLSYRLMIEDVEAIKDSFYKCESYPLDGDFSRIKNEYFLVTGTGKYFRNVELDPKTNAGIIRISQDGKSYELLWGLDSSLPTSELPTHLLNHMKIMNDGYRVILHGHQTNLIALSFIFKGSDEDLTKTLWRIMTECLVVFPKGIKVIPWMVPGNTEIGYETSKYINDYDLVLWKHHGGFVKGYDFDDAFGLIDTIEKAAEIYLKVLSTGMPTVSEITDANLKDLAEAFGVKTKSGILK